MKFFQHKGDAPDVAADVTRQVEQARNLVGITNQDLLNDPRTNPATRGHADALRIQQQRDALDLDHKRAMRRGRVADSRAAAAERTLEAIQAARETTSPGRAVAALTVSRTRYMVGCLVLSVLLSIGSGMAIEAWLQSRPGESPTGLGYLVEAGLTILSTAMIVLRGRLASREVKLEPWQAVVFWLLIGVPLAASAVLATMGSPVGAICSLGAAAWSLAAYVATATLSTAISDALVEVGAADENELRRVAMGEDHKQGQGTPAPLSGERWLSEQGDVMADQIAAFLADHDGPAGGGVAPDRSGPDHDGPAPGHSGIPTREEVQDAYERMQARYRGQARGQIDTDQGERHEPGTEQSADVAPGVAPAVQARRAAGAQTRKRVADYWYAHPDDGPAQIATALGLGESTVKRHLRAIREGR
ncbi:hypothetical protein KGD83_21810 [Nocardiopsis akebiae]|uniref:Uncharacterized protein n=1 Tax=Nocardiopsis akebiae TaxID=2831968 RepID=A0ABX8C449_9ACTN|nr:hypothetical protein [Nocardiopsis akebiae]QUX27891.1 hypothetical protein KGD83_21810 [Nocardiopsis akebiae]